MVIRCKFKKESLQPLTLCTSFHNLKGKEHKNTNGFCLKLFGKLHILMQTAWESDTHF